MSLFITFEGIDGSGKSTQAKLLLEYLNNQGKKAFYTYEPGGTDLGINLRRIVLNSTHRIRPLAEFLLMASDRAEHVEEVIKPALSKGYIVICDRYIDSSLAYQGAAGVNLHDIKLINAIATGGLEPDLTFLLDIVPEKSLNIGEADRIEERTIQYYTQVRKIYLDIAEENPIRVKRIDVNGKSIEMVAKELKTLIQPLINN